MKSTAFTVATAACIALLSPAGASAQDARSQFLATLKSLCGQRFEGGLTYAVDPASPFAGKKMVAQVANCTDKEVRVPLAVGEDRSRTWIFTQTADGLELRHDHRHADGTPDQQTMYGGPASSAGTALRQSFAADRYTADLIKGAATNVWTVTLSADGATLTYHLERDAKPRATFVLKRV
jgi:hypothetical protein